MAYTSNSHLSGAAITAAHAENWETQYSQIKATYLDKFSTASTGTTLLSCASTYTFATGANVRHMFIPIPPGIQNSRLEFSVTGQTLATAGTLVNDVYLVRGTPDASLSTSPYGSAVPYAAMIYSSFTTAAAGSVRTTGFTARGGELFTLVVLNETATDLKLWNFKIAGTSTTLTDNSSLIFKWSTLAWGIPSSTG